MTMHSDSHWGAIRPPDLAAMASDNTLPVRAADPNTATAPVQQPASERPAQLRQGDHVLPTALALAVVLGLVAIGGALLVGRHRSLRSALSRPSSRPR
jgi:hypothetical protein